MADDPDRDFMPIHFFILRRRGLGFSEKGVLNMSGIPEIPHEPARRKG
jgi:hypothetical protein